MIHLSSTIFLFYYIKLRVIIPYKIRGKINISTRTKSIFCLAITQGDSLIKPDVINTDPENGETSVARDHEISKTTAIYSGLTPNRAGDSELPTPMITITGWIPMIASVTENITSKMDMR